MTRFLRPSFIVPLILSVSLVAGLLAFGNVKTVIALMGSFQRIYLLFTFLLVIAYEAVQCGQWNVLLRALRIDVPLRAQIFAFLVGDATKILPIGNYVDNYLLLRAEGTDFGLSSSATLMSVLIEVAVTLAGLVILGLDDWNWLRPLIIIGLAVFLLVVWVISRLHVSGSLPAWLTRHPLVQAGLRELRQFRAGALALLRPVVLICAGLLATLYLLIGAGILYLVVRGLGIDTISWLQVVSVYYFSVAFSLISPLPIDIGVSEASGTGALLAYGIDKSDAVSAMLILRVLTTGGAFAIALITLIVMPDELRQVLREHPPRPAGEAKLQETPAR